MAESLSVSLSSLRLPFRHPSDRVPNAKFHSSLATCPSADSRSKGRPLTSPGPRHRDAAAAALMKRRFAF